MSESVYKEIYEEHKVRKTSQKEHILNALKGAGKDGMTNASLSNIALRYGSLIHEIERDGWSVVKLNEGEGIVRYIIGDKRASDRQNAYEILRREIEEHHHHVTYNEIIKILEVNGLHIKHRPYGLKNKKKVG